MAITDKPIRPRAIPSRPARPFEQKAGPSRRPGPAAAAFLADLLDRLLFPKANRASASDVRGRDGHGRLGRGRCTAARRRCSSTHPQPSLVSSTDRIALTVPATDADLLTRSDRIAAETLATTVDANGEEIRIT